MARQRICSSRRELYIINVFYYIIIFNNYIMSRLKELLSRNPDRIPVTIINKSPTIKLDKAKYLVPKSINVAEFQYVLRRRISLPPWCALYLFFSGELHDAKKSMETVWREKNRDGMLYAEISQENVFGGTTTHSRIEHA